MNKETQRNGPENYESEVREKLLKWIHSEEWARQMDVALDEVEERAEQFEKARHVDPRILNLPMTV